MCEGRHQQPYGHSATQSTATTIAEMMSARRIEVLFFIVVVPVDTPRGRHGHRQQGEECSWPVKPRRKAKVLPSCACVQLVALIRLPHGSKWLRCTTYFISKDSELEIKPSSTRYIDYIYAEGRIVALHVHNTTANADSLYYVQTDLLGSWDRIVNGNRQVVQRSHFDPWGNRMSAANWTQPLDGTNLAFRRGFTGHEHYDRFGIINMNARLYDPALARFFSPDPQVQAPFSTQGYNRYSYCGNNPVMYVDEDGESISGIVFSILAGAYLGGICANNSANPFKWDWSSSRTWEYIVGGAILGGVSSTIGAVVAASGVPMANTLGLAYSSFYYSCGMSALTEGQIPVTMSMGSVGYCFDSHSWGYFLKKGNNLLQNIGYGFGALANLSDLVSLFWGGGQNIDVNSAETNKNEDKCGHTSITRSHGETIVSVGPEGGYEPTSNKLIDIYNDSKLPADIDWPNYWGDDGTWSVSLSNVSTNALERYMSNVTRWDLLSNSCVAHATRALWYAGVPTLYSFHPHMLNMQLLIRELGIILSPFLQTGYDL